MEAMRRSRLAALVALALLAAPVSVVALCGALACPDHDAVRTGCHPAPTSSRLSDCCASPAPATATAAATCEAGALPREAALAPSPALELDAAALPASEARVGGGSAIPLFTLHRSLLL
jgi:hypothetical protein